MLPSGTAGPEVMGGLGVALAHSAKSPRLQTAVLVSGTDGRWHQTLWRWTLASTTPIGIDRWPCASNGSWWCAAPNLLFSSNYYATGKLKFDVPPRYKPPIGCGLRPGWLRTGRGETAEMPGMYEAKRLRIWQASAVGGWRKARDHHALVFRLATCYQPCLFPARTQRPTRWVRKIIEVSRGGISRTTELGRPTPDRPC